MHLSQMKRAGNWAALTRYWMARQHTPALEAAIDIARKRCDEGGLWPALSEYLQQVLQAPFDRSRKCPEHLQVLCTHEDHTTLTLIELWSHAVLCDLICQVPIDQQSHQFRISADAARKSKQLAEDLGDHSLSAMHSSLLATAYFQLNESHSAKEAYEEALAIYRQLAIEQYDLFQPDVFHTLNCLGNVLLTLHQFEDAKNAYAEAIVGYRKLIATHSATYSSSLAIILRNIGQVFYALQDLDSTRGVYEEAANLYQQLSREHWDDHVQNYATCLNDLFIVLVNLGQWENASVTLQELVGLNRRLAEAAPGIYIPKLTESLYNLGTASHKAWKLQASCEAYKEAVASCRQFLKVNPEIYLKYFVGSLCGLGNVYRDLKEFDLSHKTLDEALAVCNEFADTHPEIITHLRARTLEESGTTLSDLKQLEKAMQAYEEASVIYKKLAAVQPENYQLNVAMALNSLALVLWNLHKLEASHVAYNESLEILRKLNDARPDIHSPTLAMTLSNFGLLLRDSRKLDAACNVLEESLKIRRRLVKLHPEIYKPGMAFTLNNLGTILRILQRLKESHDAHKEALEIRRQLEINCPGRYTKDLAVTLVTLGNVQGDMQQFQEAEEAYKEALAKFRQLALDQPEIYLRDVAGTLNDLGLLLVDLKRLREAKLVFEEALDLQKANETNWGMAELLGRQRAYHNLGKLYLRKDASLGLPDYARSLELIRHAGKYSEQHRRIFRSYQYRDMTQGRANTIYSDQIEAYLGLYEQTNDTIYLENAVETAEAARSRSLLERISHETNPGNTPPDLFAAYLEVRNKIDKAGFYLQLKSTQMQNEIEQFQIEEANLIGRIQEYDPQWDPRQVVPPVSYAQIQCQLQDHTQMVVIEFMQLEDRCVAFLLTKGGIEIVSLDDWNGVTSFRTATAWFREYDQEEWYLQIPARLLQIEASVITPLWKHLESKEFTSWLFVPHQNLHMFPLHACRLPGGRYLADVVEVSYAPSLSILELCRLRNRSAVTDHWLGIENPTADLYFAGLEIQQIQSRYTSTKVYRGHEVAANMDQLLIDSAKATVWHYAGHAEYNGPEPMKSKLNLSKEFPAKDLTLEEIFVKLRLDSNRLTVLSGCETGMLIPRRIDEYHSLSSGFLFAGAIGVICSQWQVDDIATCLLMERFYDHWQQGLSIAASLSRAQFWLRMLTICDVVNQLKCLELGFEALQNHQYRNTIREQILYFESEGDQSIKPFDQPCYWAAFAAVGYVQ